MNMHAPLGNQLTAVGVSVIKESFTYQLCRLHEHMRNREGPPYVPQLRKIEKIAPNVIRNRQSSSKVVHAWGSKHQVYRRFCQ